MTLTLTGRITEERVLEVELPESVPPGEARVTIEILEKSPRPPEDLAVALPIEPLTAAEIVAAGLTGGSAAEGITDGQGWVEGQRQARRSGGAW